MAHTADVIIEAWGADVASCCEESVAALVDTYLAARGREVVAHRDVHLAAGPPEALVLATLDEVIFTLDTARDVPVGATVRAADDGGLDITIVLAGRDAVEGTGAVPKAVSRSGLDVDVRPDRVRVRCLVDV